MARRQGRAEGCLDMVLNCTIGVHISFCLRPRPCLGFVLGFEPQRRQRIRKHINARNFAGVVTGGTAAILDPSPAAVAPSRTMLR